MRPGLQYRLLLRTLGAALLFAIVAGGLAYRLGQSRAQAAAQNTISSLQRAVDKTAAIAVFAHDATLMREVLEGVTRDPLVRSAEIADPTGHALWRTGPGAVGGPPGATLTWKLVSPFDGQEVIGSLRFELDDEGLHRSAQQQAWTMALMMVAQALLIAAVIHLASVKLVSRPIVSLAGDLSTMKPGSSRRLTPPQGHESDEIGTLVRSANLLLQSNELALAREVELRRDIEVMEAQYRQIFDSTSAGIFVLDRDGQLINGNPTVLKVIGGGVQELRQLRGCDFLELVFARPERARAMIDQARLRRETISADLELRAHDGRTRWAHCLLSVQGAGLGESPGQPAPPGSSIIEGVLYDITERKEVESDARRRAERDDLTGVLNRAGVDASLDHFLDAAGEDDHLSLLYLDLDGFKQVNDLYGHHCGDQVLQLAVARIQGTLRRQSDIIGRVGGDEFVVIMTNSGPTDAAACAVAAAIVEQLCAPFRLDGDVVAHLGVSIGVASAPRHGRGRRQLLRAADDAMYDVKRHGKNAFSMALHSPEAQQG